MQVGELVAIGPEICVPRVEVAALIVPERRVVLATLGPDRVVVDLAAAGAHEGVERVQLVALRPKLRRLGVAPGNWGMNRRTSV